MASWYPALAIATLRADFNRVFPGRDKSTDGVVGDTAHSARKSDHNPDWDSTPPGIVRAIDVDKDLLGKGTESAVMQSVVDRLIRDPRIAYVIFRRRIWQNPEVYRNGGWNDYTPAGKSGWFNPHEEHAHFSIRHGARWENDTTPWFPQEDDMTPQLSERLDEIVHWLDTRVDQLAAHTDKTIRTELDKRLTGDRRRLAFESAVVNGVVTLDPDGPFYVVEWDGSLTPVTKRSWDRFRTTPAGSKVVVERASPERHEALKDRMNAPGSAI